MVSTERTERNAKRGERTAKRTPFTHFPPPLPGSTLSTSSYRRSTALSPSRYLTTSNSTGSSSGLGVGYYRSLSTSANYLSNRNSVAGYPSNESSYVSSRYSTSKASGESGERTRGTASLLESRVSGPTVDSGRSQLSLSPHLTSPSLHSFAAAERFPHPHHASSSSVSARRDRHIFILPSVRFLCPHHCESIVKECPNSTPPPPPPSLPLEILCLRPP